MTWGERLLKTQEQPEEPKRECGKANRKRASPPEEAASHEQGNGKKARRVTFRMRLGVKSNMPGLPANIAEAIEAIEAMERDETLTGITFGEDIMARNLKFKDTPPPSIAVRQKFAAVDITTLELERAGDPPSILLAWEFTARWDEVSFDWLKEAFGGTVTRLRGRGATRA